MKTPKNACRLVGTGLLLLAASVAQAKKVDYVDVTKGDGIYLNHGKVEVSVVNGEYAQITSGNTVPFHLRMKAGCKNNDVVKTAFVSYGQENVSGGILEASDNYQVSLSNQGMGQTMPYTPAKLDVPVNRLGVDPVKMCRDMMQEKLGQGLAKHQILNAEHTLGALVTFTAVAGCGKWHESERTFAKDTFTDQLTVVCKAGAAAPGGNTVQAPKGPITVVPLGGSGQIQTGFNPLVIAEGEIIAGGMKNFVGTCPAQLSMAVKIRGSGKGKVRVHVVDGSDKIWESVPLDYDGKQGWKQMNFFYNLPASPEYLNTKKDRSFRLYVELKDEKADTFSWSPKGDLDTFSWSHTCKPSVAVPMGGQGGVKLAPAAPGGDSQPPRAVMPVPVKPLPASNLQAPVPTPEPGTPQRIAPPTPATPPMPTPGSLQAVPVQPSPKPALKIAPINPAPADPSAKTQ